MKEYCWSCEEEVKDFFCLKCGKIQPISPRLDYFTCLGQERKLNLDASDVERRFHSLSRKFHPDFYQGKSSEEQAISQDNASILNKAYRTLRDPIAKIEYLIELEQGPEEGIRCQVPPDLLEEVLELHSRLEEVHSLKNKLVSEQSEREGGALEVLPQEGATLAPIDRRESPELKKEKDYLRSELAKLEGRFQTLKNQIQQLSQEWDGLKEEENNRKILSEFRMILSQRTYLLNVIEDIQKVL